MHDSLGDRMKRQYENRTRVMLPRRTYTILRADGKAFSSFTRGCWKPYDVRVAEAMEAAMLALCREAQGSRLGYVQSDEISVLLTDFTTITTEAWFDGNLQKIVSVADGTALFDCRVFTIPDPIEVENYFIWRQQDAARNSIQSLAQAHFSHKQLQGLNVNELQDKLMFERGVNWNDLPAAQKRGRAGVYRDGDGWLVDVEPPMFTKDRTYLTQRIRLEPSPDPASPERT
jgi:tRNA(His) guanylyltransferase